MSLFCQQQCCHPNKTTVGLIEAMSITWLPLKSAVLLLQPGSMDCFVPT